MALAAISTSQSCKGLAQAALMPDRFSQLTIMNTWLHHDSYRYSDAIRKWNSQWHENGL
jgi:hypothetical protein